MTQPVADPTILSANISEVRAGLDMSPSNASFVASLATLTLAAAVLGAGALGDLYGMRRMFTVGLFGAIGFGLLAAAAPNSAVLIGARAGVGIAFAFLLGLSLAITNAVFPPHRRDRHVPRCGLRADDADACVGQPAGRAHRLAQRVSGGARRGSLP